jgi:hypothetical protein
VSVVTIRHLGHNGGRRSMTTAASEQPSGASPVLQDDAFSPAREEDPSNERVLRWFLWGAVALAVFVRVAFLWSKPFWRDEAWVALLVDDPMRAAADARAVPVGFLFLVRLTSAIPLLPPEVTYRIVPLLCGIAVVPLIAKLATALGASRRTGVIAAWIAAGLAPFVYYSRELKSYDIDLLLAVLLPLAALRGFTGSAPSGRARAVLAASVVAGPWVSFAGLFPIGAVLSWGWLAWWKNLGSTLRRDWLLCSAAFLVSFAVAYVVALGAQSTSETQYRFWDRFLVSGGSSPFLAQAVESVRRYFSITMSYPFGELKTPVLLLATLGAWSWPRAGRAYFFWLAGSMAALCLAATVMDRYVIAQGRHLLFAVPAVVLCVAQGLDAIAARLGRRAGMVLALALPVLVSLWWTGEQIESRTKSYHSNWTRFFRYDVLHDVEGALDKVARDIPDGDPVLVTNKNAYAFQFYRRGRLPQATYCVRYCFDFKDRADDWLDGVDGRGWILMTDEEPSWFAKLLDKHGFTRRQRTVGSGIRLWQIDRVADRRAIKSDAWKKKRPGPSEKKAPGARRGDSKNKRGEPKAGRGTRDGKGDGARGRASDDGAPRR